MTSLAGVCLTRLKVLKMSFLATGLKYASLMFYLHRNAEGCTPFMQAVRGRAYPAAMELMDCIKTDSLEKDTQHFCKINYYVIFTQECRGLHTIHAGSTRPGVPSSNGTDGLY